MRELVVTPTEYKRIRETLELTQGQLSELLGVRLNTVSRRELGQFPITKEAELALRYLADRASGRAAPAKRGRNARKEE